MKAPFNRSQMRTPRRLGKKHHLGEIEPQNQVGRIQLPMCDSFNAFLERVASISTRTYLLEDVFMNLLSRSSCASTANVAVPQDILFIIMCSVDKQDRLHSLHSSWIRWVPNVILLAESVIPGFNITVLPELGVDDYVTEKFPHPTNYQLANLRHLKSLKWVLQFLSTASIKWVMMTDDDTFVNIPLLLGFIGRFPHVLPLLIGHMWDSPAGWLPPTTQGSAWPSGGGGMLMSREGFQRLATLLLSPKCKLTTFLNDLNIGLCAPVARVVKVHSLKFKAEPSTPHYSPHVEDVGMALTQHRVSNQQMVMYACLVARRYSWQHSVCNHTAFPCNPICHA